jgi:signal transduction histidine kinase
VPAGVLWPLVVTGVGVVVLWTQADDAQRARWRAATGNDRLVGVLRTLTGVVLVVVGSSVVFSRQVGVGEAGPVAVAVLVVVAGLALVSGPWWLRMARELSAERAARIREQERAEIAAHVHDSVLHTLALIQRHADDPREIGRLARAQERDLRTWLYRPAPAEALTLRAAIERAAAEVEDAHGATVEVVVVGDCPLDDSGSALLHATREALVNAAKYAGAAPVAVYAEVDADRIEVFVRDRGPGFDLARVPADRMGVRQSVIGRMERNGGRAVVRSAHGAGTEIRLEMPVQPSSGRPPS